MGLTIVDAAENSQSTGRYTIYLYFYLDNFLGIKQLAMEARALYKLPKGEIP